MVWKYADQERALYLKIVSISKTLFLKYPACQKGMLSDFKDCLKEEAPHIQKFMNRYINMFDEIVHSKDDNEKNEKEIRRVGKKVTELYS